MKGIIVLIIVATAIVNSKSDSDENTNTTVNDSHINFTTSEDKTGDNKHNASVTNAEERPLRPVFPKRNQKFIVTTETTRPKNASNHSNRPSNKPVFKIVPKVTKTKTKDHWRIGTKRPTLMKHRKFTIDPLSNNEYRFSTNDNKSDEEEENERKNRINLFRKTMKSTDKDDDSSEESSDEDSVSEKRRNKVKHFKTLIHRYHKLGSKISRENEKISSESKETAGKLNNFKNDTLDKPKSEVELSAEEKQDRNEFIFVPVNKTEENNLKITENSEEADETTTIIIEKELKSRQKKSINVIEEENLGTTVSGFKFTGKVKALSSDLVFRNINT